MNRYRSMILCTVLILIFAFAVQSAFIEKGSAVMPKANAPIASVRVVPIEKGTVVETLVTYGKVIPSPGRAKILSIPYECLIKAIYVTQGQEVGKGAKLLEIGPSPDTLLKLKRAISNYEVTKALFKKVKERVALKLATNQELLQAEQAYENAKIILKNMEERRISKTVAIRSKSPGIVSRLFAHQGSMVPAGNPIIEIVAQDAVEVCLGAEPEDAYLIVPGHHVLLKAVNRPSQKTVSGIVRSVSKSINPASRFVDVFVSLPSPPPFLLNEYVQGDIIVASREGLVVPKNAVLPEDGHYILFTVKNGRAHRHIVSIGLESGKEVEISGVDIKEGELAVVLGNYELRDGMSVAVEKTP